MVSDIQKINDRHDTAQYLKKHRITAGAIWQSIMRYNNPAWGVYNGEKLTGLFVKNEKWREVRIHGGDESAAKTLFFSLKKGKWHLFDFPSRYLPLVETLGRVSVEEPAILFKNRAKKPLIQNYKGPITTLKLADAPLVHKRWGLDKDKEMVAFFKRRIAQGPTSAIEINGELVAWAGTYHHTPWVTQLGYLHVEKGHRRNGYGMAVAVDIINKALSKGRIPLVHVFDTNYPSLNMIKKLKFVPVEKRFWGSVVIGKT